MKWVFAADQEKVLAFERRWQAKSRGFLRRLYIEYF